MSITFVYRDENNKVQVKKIDYEEVKKWFAETEQISISSRVEE